MLAFLSQREIRAEKEDAYNKEVLYGGHALTRQRVYCVALVRKYRGFPRYSLNMLE